MNFLTRIYQRVTGKAEAAAYTKAMRESADLYDYYLDGLGWDRLSGLPGFVSGRRYRPIRDEMARNLRKYDEDGIVKCEVRLHTDFTFGRGIDVPKSKSPVIQEEIINPFWWSLVNQRNYFGFFAQQRRHKEMTISGELNLLVKIDPITSLLRLYPLMPDDIKEIIPDPDEPERNAFYLLRRQRRTWDFSRNEWSQSIDENKPILHRAMRYKIFEASDAELQMGLVYHVGMNEFFEHRRGQSDISTIFEPAESARNMAEDGATLSSANAEIAYKTKLHKGGSSVKDKIIEMLRTKTDGSNPARAAGSEWVENESLTREWQQARDTGSGHREKDMRAMKLYAFAGMGFGEHYTGNPETGNLATAEAMELPVIKMTQAEQKRWISIYSDLTDFQIDVAAVAGKLKGRVIDNNELEVEITENRSYSYKFPPIVQRSPVETIAALGQAVDKNLIPENEAARIVMDAFEVEDIDEALEVLSGEKEIKDELAKIQAQAQPAFGVPGMLAIEKLPKPKGSGNGGGNGNGE